MEERTKQRLVGVLVFVGALFIVLPFLFHNAHPTGSASQKVEEANAAVAVAMPSENKTASAVAPQTLASNNTMLGSTDQAQMASTTVSPDAMQPATTNTVPAAPSQANMPSLPAAPLPAQSVNTAAVPSVPAMVPANPVVASDAGGTSAAPATNPTKFPSIAPANAPAASPAIPDAAQPIPAMPVNNLGATTETNTQQKSSPVLNKAAPATLPIKAGVVAKKTLVPSEAVKVEIKKPVVHAMAAQSAVATGGWTVQVGAFSDKANAHHLMATLREHRFHVYSRQLAQPGRAALTIVFVGPERSLDHARFAQQHLRAAFKLNGEIKRYEA